ncbi:hypothetical protein RO3G_01175 [Rhizopus delemar RA 99-880]|uniref:serine C-palmitoyltransferase n=1 Tax=Rhizopus delemar (strain RA 99-880 / ATCC MYA-4621 / FGSC 9543 / NRRL 43880) TaxID=246409 RepID=I1BJU1_RHIO9|nr:hypothetical protein RO3G_01175 [Rhizopus delemar RA 99-880]|eukprot:EIE76471.1 hypothetical protein RO3G_01175 [Rhizopus delemar RA 99-880]
MTNEQVFQDPALFINSTINSIYELIITIPGSHLAISYLKNAYQNDPFRVVLELFLVFFAMKYMFSRKYKPNDNNVVLTDKEIDELVEEWQPEPLAPKLSSYDRFNLEKIPVLTGPQSAKAKIAGHAKPLMNLATSNFLNLTASEQIRFSTISSVIPAFAKRGDYLVVDEGVSFAVQKGVQISRSIVRFYKHNDMEDLEKVLNEIQAEHIKHKKRLTRRFIVTEGLFANFGDIAPLDKLVELKKKFKYRLILDESQSIGVIGNRGAGLTDLYNIDAKEVDMIVGSLANALCGSGGFCAGSVEVVDHQRLSGSAYCFSASMPAMLAVSASEAFRIISQQPSLLKELAERISTLRQVLLHKSLEPYIYLESSDPHSPSPFFHVRIKETFFHHEVSRETEERLLQDVVDECASQGVLVTRAKYVYEQELNCPKPSIKIQATIGLSKKENDKAAHVVKAAIVKIFSKTKK